MSKMVVGILREIKPSEQRVAMTPDGAEQMVSHGHSVLVERGAGLGSGFCDEAYVSAGAGIAASPEEVFASSQMVMHVKEPQPCEYGLIRPWQIVFTYFHFAESLGLTQGMMVSHAVCVAYETARERDGTLPMLAPMSEVAGRLAGVQAAKYLEMPQGGRGVLMGGVPGVEPATVVVLGGGTVGVNAALMVSGLGAKTYVLDINLERLRYLSQVMPKNCIMIKSSAGEIRRLVREADAVIGAVLVPGAKAPHLITRNMLRTMKPGAVLVDVAIDQGGCFETSHPTTHLDPVFLVDGKLHYCVANMPGAVPMTSTPALTNATLPYALMLADKGWQQAARDSEAMRLALNVIDGLVVCSKVAEAFGMQCVDASRFL